MYESFEFATLPTADEARSVFRRIAASTEHLRGRAVDKPLALYGAGSLGRMAKEYCERVGIPVEFVIDANAAAIRNDPFWSGVHLVGPEEVTPAMQCGRLLAICIVTCPYVPIATHLRAAGWSDAVPFYDIADRYSDRHPLSNGWFAEPFQPTDEQGVENALDAWSDDISRAHHLQFIAWRRLRQEWSFRPAPIDIGNRFFIPEIMSVLKPAEQFLDAGAHLGHVTQSFIAKVGGKFARIWAIEPDRLSMAGLEAAIAELSAGQQAKIAVLPVAVGKDESIPRFFEGLDYASQCSPIGNTTVRCTTIDALGVTPTFMKLHLEGMELDALRGAVNTIKEYRPIITATTYHNAEGLWQLPRWLKDNLEHYWLHMRLHAWCGTGATVYAIPHERREAGEQATTAP